MSEKLIKVIFGVTGVLLISRFLGFVREMVIADKFGTSPEYDLYLIAIMLPALLYGVINFAAVYVFVPFLSNKKDSSDNLFWNDIQPAVNLSIVVAAVSGGLIFFLAPLVLKIWGSQYSDAEFSKIVFYCRLISVMLLLGTTEAFMRAYLNVKKVFVYPSSGYIIYNIFCIGGIILFYQTYSVGAIIVGLLGGLLAQNLFLLLKVLQYQPFKHFKFGIINDDTKFILSTGSLIILIEFINRSYFLLDRYVALPFGDGVISALNYSQVLVQLPDSIVGFAIGAVVFPYFADASSKLEDKKFADVFTNVIKGALYISIPIAVLFYINAREIVVLLFQRGVFDERSVELTTSVLRPHSLTIISLFIISTSIRAAYSAGWTKYIFRFAVGALVIKTIGNFVLPDFMGYPGISMSTSITFLSMAVMMVVLIMKKNRLITKAIFALSILKFIIIYVLSLGYSYLINLFLLNDFQITDKVSLILKLTLSGFSLIVFYLVLTYLFKLNEVTNHLFKRKPEDE